MRSRHHTESGIVRCGMRLALAAMLWTTNASNAAESASAQESPVAAPAIDPRLAEAERLKQEVVAHYRAGEYEQAIPKARKALELSEAVLGPDHYPTVASALNYLAELLKSTGRYAEAEPLLRRALAISERALGPDHPVVAGELKNLAELLCAAGRYAEAEPLYRRALAIDEKALGPDHPDVATDLNNLAALFKMTGRYAEAEPLYRRAVAIGEKALGPDHPHVATALNILALLLETTGRYAEAEPLYRRALAIDEKAFGPDRPDVATDLNNLASLLQITGRYAEAETLHRRALAIDEKALGPDHPDVATELDNLASLLQTTGRYAEAETLHRRALAIREKALGADQVDVAYSLIDLAELLRITGRYAEAEPLYRRALAIREKALGTDHPNVATSLNSLALLLATTGRYAEAEPLYRRALAIDEKALGQDHPHVAIRLNNLALLLATTGRYAEAEPLYRRALAIDEKALGADHADVANNLNNLAELLRITGRSAEAEALYRRALAIREKALGANHVDVANSLNNLALMLAATGRYAEGEPLYRRALAIDEKALGPDHPDVATDLNNLALLLATTGRYAEGEPLYRRALAIDEKALGPDHPDVATDLKNLAGLLQTTGRYSEAEPLLLRAYRIASTAGDAEVLWTAQSALRDFYAVSHPALAIFYGKQAVNTLQALRAGWSSSDQVAQKAFAKSVSGVYRHLSDLLIDQGRLPESEQVLGLLKQQELFDYLRRDSDSDAVHSTPSYTREEDPLAARYSAISTRVIALARERADLMRINPTLRTQAQSARLTDLDSQLDTAREEVMHFIDDVSSTFRESGGRKAVDFGEKELKSLEEVQQSLADLGEHGHPAILIHYLVTPERVRILVTTADTQVHRDSAIREAEVNKLVGDYRQTLQNANRDPRPQAKALYDALIAPIADDLAQAGPATLMFSLDGVLRYLPMAALYDGRHWLIENHSLVMYTAAARSHLDSLPQAQWRVAGLGVSKGGEVGTDSFKPLPAVPTELGAIVRDGQVHSAGVLPGIERLDNAFTRDALVEAIRDGYPVLHIASHFNFKPTEDGSYLLLGNNQSLTLTDFRKGINYRLTKVDLLTLSACETAMDTVEADGREIEGLGALAQERGAKSVMATLWSVNDATTGSLMQRFYQHRQQRHLTKAEALREAQLVFIRGEPADVRVHLSTDRGAKPVVLDPDPLFKSDPKAPYAHPYFWAPFILMGNWL